ncbi:MAG: methyltransferase domain-containing protein [Candidatus Bathyarchaeota archaeon]|nr:methyltransferase domain-containing protein [Candidatus Bathyarchaeota archaeon]
MSDPLYLEYVEYFKQHPSAQEYYYRVGKESSASAKELSKKMGLSIQTVTNALRDLERIGLLKSEKSGRVRVYTLKDPRLFKGLSSVRYTRYARFASHRRHEDFVSKSIFNQHMEKWIRYLADIMEGKLYADQTFYTHILHILKVDYVIESQTGQKLILIINVRTNPEVEAVVARVLSLVLSGDINPNIESILSVFLINRDRQPQTLEEQRIESDFIEFIRTTFGMLSETARKYQVLTQYIIETVLPGDVEKPEFSEKLSNAITRALPYSGKEALPGEVNSWLELSNVFDRRNRAFDSVQKKISQKHMWLISPWREILPRDKALSQVLFPQGLLESMGLKVGDVFVEEGCQEGLFTIAAAKIVGEKGKVYGIEVAPNLVEKIRKQLDQEKLQNVILVNDFPEKTILEHGVADIVFFGAVLNEMYNPFRSMKNARAMLKDSGKLVILEWKGRDPDWKPSREEQPDAPLGPRYEDRLDKKLIIRWVKEAGFKIEEEKEYNFYLYSIIATKQ